MKDNEIALYFRELQNELVMLQDHVSAQTNNLNNMLKGLTLLTEITKASFDSLLNKQLKEIAELREEVAKNTEKRW